MISAYATRAKTAPHRLLGTHTTVTGPYAGRNRGVGVLRA